MIIMLFFKGSEASRLIIDGMSAIIPISIWLFVGSRREGEKVYEYRALRYIIPMLIIFALQNVIALLFLYPVYLVGPAIDFGKSIAIMAGVDVYNQGIPILPVHLCMLAYDFLLFLPAVICGSYFGTKKRIKERESLMSNAGGK